MLTAEQIVLVLIVLIVGRVRWLRAPPVLVGRTSSAGAVVRSLRSLNDTSIQVALKQVVRLVGRVSFPVRCWGVQIC